MIKTRQVYFIYPYPSLAENLYKQAVSTFFRLSWKIRILESIFKQNKNWLRVKDFVCKTLRLVRISVLISAITKSFFSGELFYKSNGKLFPGVCIAWYKHSRGWKNSLLLCKPSTSSRVCISVSNSPNPSRVYIRLCKDGKRFLLLKYDLARPAYILINVWNEGSDLASFVSFESWFQSIRGTQQRFPPKCIENTFWAILGTFRPLEMYSN